MIKCKNTCPVGKFDGCCHECDLNDTCKEVCQSNPSDCGESVIEADGNELQVFKTSQMAVIQSIADICTAKKKLEEQEKDLKEKLKDAMEKCNVKKFTNDILNITYIAATTSTGVDSKKLKENYPEIFKDCSKVSNKSAYVKVEVKG